jgi:hypothetical protein
MDRENEGVPQRAGIHRLKPNQKYLKFPLTLPLSPAGEREGVRGQQNVRDKFSGLTM